MNNLIILGGTGFIGKECSKHFQRLGYNILCVSRSSGKVNSNYVFHCTIDQFLDKNFPEQFKNKSYVVNLIHSTVPSSSNNDFNYEVTSNIPLHLKILEVVSSLNVKKYIYVSSGGTVYGNNNSFQIKEESHLEPISSYGISKLAIEKFTLLYILKQNLPGIIVRPANVYGETQEARQGQGLIAYCVKSIIEKKPITIFGDTGGIRDYVHAFDVARAFEMLFSNGKIGEIYNIGTGIGTSSIDLAMMILNSLPKSKRVEIIRHAERAFDVKINVLSIEKISLDTNWKPEITLDQGLKLIIKKLN